MKIIRKLFWPLAFLALTLLAIKVLYDVNLTPNTIEMTTQNRRLMQKNQTKATNKAQAQITSVDLQDLAAAKKQLPHTLARDLVGQLQIPAIDLNLPILKVATDQTLSTGAAQYFPERPMGTGNYVLASHNFIGAHVLMHDIGMLKTGAKMTTTDGTHTYVYQVVSNRVVHQSQTQLLQPTKQAQLMLIRCEGRLHTPYRRIVTGKLVRTIPRVAVKKTAQTTFSYQSVVQRLGHKQWLVAAAEILAELLAGKRPLLLIAVLLVWAVLMFLIILKVFK
ncbi:class A sortase [Lapidilactobacillus bayanensis]|uniref:class A sortase n=1 Tax=Lapidilactobacillus bayanensis TaxID=2485998 RepID=UPI000F772905|nr:class A sortase [Lapidilactobacillus bayanensis]